MKQSWWFFLLLGCAAAFYFHGMWDKEKAYQELCHKLQVLQHEKKEVIAKRQELVLQVQSQNDPAFIEMTLIRGLGMVPDGQVKVYFQP